MSEILGNALDSLRMGLSHYLDERLENRDKWATLELFHAIELLCKERLYQEHPLLIYRNIDKVVGDDAATVGLQDILGRFANLGVEVSSDHVKILTDLQHRRNRIEHHRFVPDASHKFVLGKALIFISYFLEEHLGEDIEDHLPPELFREAKHLLLGYQALLRKAKAAIASEKRYLHPKEQALLAVGTCPECGNATVLVGAGDGDFCYFCDRGVHVSMCSQCGEYLPEDDLSEVGICHECFSYKVSRD